MIHYENSKLYLTLALKLKKKNCVLELNQSQWLKPYIEFNSQKWKDGEKDNDKYGKALYKLMNNTIYRKAMENLKNRINVKLVNNGMGILKLRKVLM